MYTSKFNTATYRIHWIHIEGIHATTVDSPFPHCCESGAELADWRAIAQYAARNETGPNTKEYAESGSPERWLGVNARRLSDSRVFVASIQSFVRKDACVSSVSLSQWIDDCLSGW